MHMNWSWWISNITVKPLRTLSAHILVSGVSVKARSCRNFGKFGPNHSDALLHYLRNERQ